MGQHEKPGCSFHGKDVIVTGPKTESGQMCIRHRADHTVEVGTVRPVDDGEPIRGEIVALSGDGPTYDVETVYGGRTEEGEAVGPAKVTSDAYRRGWDSVFGKPATVGQA